MRLPTTAVGLLLSSRDRARLAPVQCAAVGELLSSSLERNAGASPPREGFDDLTIS